MTNYQYHGSQKDLACKEKIGTVTGRQRHRRAGEEPCDFCRAAHSEYNRIWRLTHKRTARSVLASRMRSRALLKLKDMHPEDYRRLLSAEWAAEANHRNET